jgi:Protein of unknown function (DUF3551)
MRFLILPSALAAVLLAATQSAHAQAGDKPVCLRAPSGVLSCLYDSFTECQLLAKDNALGVACVERPITTGGPDVPRALDAPRPHGIDAPRGVGPNSLDRLPR